MVMYAGSKYNCDLCIKRHCGTCSHDDRVLYLVKSRVGRPFTYCTDCYAKFKTKLPLNKCRCELKIRPCNAIKKNPSTGTFEVFPCDDETIFNIRLRSRSKVNRRKADREKDEKKASASETKRKTSKLSLEYLLNSSHAKPVDAPNGTQPTHAIGRREETFVGFSGHADDQKHEMEHVTHIRRLYDGPNGISRPY